MNTLIRFEQQIRMKENWILFFTLPLLTFGCLICEKTITDPVFSTTPKITLLEISNDTIVQYQRSIMVYTTYEDGDGDLDTADPDGNSILIKDQRLRVANKKAFELLALEGSLLSIKETFNPELSNTFLLRNGSQETTVFKTNRKDRASHKGNLIEKEEIVILRELHIC